MPFTLEIGQKAVPFELLATDNRTYSLDDFRSNILVIFFTCNHCPYVTGSDEETRKTVDRFKEKNVQFIGINSNSKNTYEEDSFENMIIRMKKQNFPWHYLHDPEQITALNYGALKTPHFFIFNHERNLVYTGRGVDSPLDSSKIKVNNLELALDEFTSNDLISIPITNPIGCSIKWEGRDSRWMPPEACDLI